MLTSWWFREKICNICNRAMDKHDIMGHGVPTSCYVPRWSDRSNGVKNLISTPWFNTVEIVKLPSMNALQEEESRVLLSDFVSLDCDPSRLQFLCLRFPFEPSSFFHSRQPPYAFCLNACQRKSTSLVPVRDYYQGQRRQINPVSVQKKIITNPSIES